MIGDIIYSLANISSEELTFLKDASDELSPEQQKKFILLYKTKRRDPHLLLFFALFGFLGLAGIHRFATNRLLMGLLYFFTAGLFFIGTFIDVLNYKNIANTYNQKIAKEAFAMAQIN
ncbi:MAG: TM2 domain-containing protein [Sphingobacteriales bacterium]|nr:MAG: TM2 domain-containing protein [Sphingobacteriales bacterium]TAF79296.1 MAG: TM2 domain-containing protein [Sphingobacteriales bacterium]